MSGLNKCTFIGNLGRDAELKSVGGHPLLAFSLACTEKYLDRNKERQERTEWVNCSLWGPRANGLSKYMTKGARAYVEARVATTKKDDKYYTSFVVTEVILLGDGKRHGSYDGGSTDSMPPIGPEHSDDLPF